MARVGTVLVALGVFALGLPAAAGAPQTDALSAEAPASQPASAGDVDDHASASSPEATTHTDSDEVSASSQPAAAATSVDAASAGAAESPASMPAASSAASQPASSAASQPASRPAAAAVPLAPEDVTPAGEDLAVAGTADTSAVSSSSNVLPAEVKERRLVAFVAAGVATVALGAGIALGVVAQQRYQCLADVVACNQTLEEPLVGDAFLEARAEVENLSLLADMSYVLAAGSALVAVTSFVRGFLLPVETEEVTP